MNDWKQKLILRLPAMLLLAVSLLFWGLYDRYEQAGPVLLNAPSLADATRLRGDCSGTNGHFVLHVPAGGKPASINFRMPDAVNHGLIRVRGRMKTTGVVVGKNPWRCARLLTIQYDRNNKWIPNPHGVVSEHGTQDWETYEDIFELDPRAAHVDLVIQQTGTAGSAEFDRLVAEPVRLRASFQPWRMVFSGVWVSMAILYFRRCRLHRRSLNVLIMLNAFAIIIGTLMPERWIDDIALHARTEVVKVVESANKPAEAPNTPRQPVRPRDPEVVIDQFNEAVGGAHGAGHFILFASLCFLVYCSAAREGQHRSYYVKVAFDVLLFAAITESLQHLTMDRTPGVHDWLVDACGMATAFGIFLMASRVAQWRSARRTG